MRLPCIVCENGDVYSNIVCDDCEVSIEMRKDTYEYMVNLVMNINKIMGIVPPEMKQEIHERVAPLYEELCKIKIKDTRNIL